MFEKLQERLEATFKKIRGYGKVTEDNIKDSLREVRIALLEADVNYKVAKDFLEKIKEKAIGEGVLTSITPGQLFVKTVHDELCELLGQVNKPLDVSGSPPVSLMLIGLQGSGKTTTAGKLALQLRKKGRKPLLVPSDVYRPAAIDQLLKIGQQINIATFAPKDIRDPIVICKEARIHAMKNGFDTMIIDTAGRLHINDEMVEELVKQKGLLNPRETLLVLDAMTGQDAVTSATTFNEKVGVDGIILTKLDGDTRGGAALSIKAVTGKPIKFIGVGEKLDALEPFFPERMASRILGMGDVVSLVEKAQEVFDEKQAKELERKLRKDEFTLEDFRDQLKQMKQLGSIESIIGMIPGLNKLKGAIDFTAAEKDIRKTEAIINSMTARERVYPNIIDGSRRMRIAKGSGTQVHDVNDLLKKYMETRKMIKKMTKGGMKGLQRQLLFR
ncbi:MAG TPA: signal recognition particle protein [Syntrophorhabdus sp.]|jgi:signal recognition particle subunit SRP54|nr:MAG: Signal recognition particle protein [Syntrophorhabdus sp. PtaB.Bin027]HNQ47055.1 signal recognition particle protein [Syntrophorhabdus sp.]HNY70618.1 signal recognition particle protein [Syntrophorhabdus sp.]HPB37147.1 signal recognition particle protein [Syntrophorhabdus sp.]HQH82637.1 signal recognition particle protein [Syntrophorhabdus sp.]